MERLTGIGVSPGIAVGRAVVLTQRTEVVRFPIPPERIGQEVEALQRARRRSAKDSSSRAKGMVTIQAMYRTGYPSW